MPSEKSELLRSTLDMLILQTVALGPIHGYAIGQRILQISRAGRKQLDVERTNRARLSGAIALVLAMHPEEV